MADTASERDIEHSLKKIKAATSAENFGTVEKYLRFSRAKGSTPKTIAKNMFCLARFIGYMPKKVRLDKAKKDDIEEAVSRVEGSDYAPNTKQNIKVVIKSLYKHIAGEDYYYPKQVAWIKTSLNKYKKKLPDILSEDEILKMLHAARSPRDEAIIALLFDTGMRVGELVNLRFKDINLDSKLSHVTVDGKTGMRRIPIMFSVPYVTRYLDTIKDAKPNDQVWKPSGTWSNREFFLDSDVIRRIVQRAGARAGIQKRIYPHLFRHSRASYYANRLTEQQLKVFFGWTGSSTMAATYVHLSGRDIDNAILQANGVRPADSLEESRLKVRVCPKCRYENAVSALHCSRCGSALDMQTAMKEKEMERKAEDLLSRSFESDEEKRARSSQHYGHT